MRNKIILKINGKEIIVDYNILGLKQVINFLELEEKQLEPKKGRKFEMPMQVAP